MKYKDPHISDPDLLLYLEGELSPPDARVVAAHLEECWNCRTRRQELEAGITNFVHVYKQELSREVPPGSGPRALLKARLAQLSEAQAREDSPILWHWSRSAAGIAALGIIAISLFFVPALIRQSHSRTLTAGVVSVPDSRLTPGATVLANRNAVCAQFNANNKTVSAATERKVFEEYGIAGADPRAYEIDYLVTPALGGADDIHNLWPHSHSATVWNAQVKDDLETRMRNMVCEGQLDLTEAQREIAGNWIAAYKKYFHTDRPLEEHLR